MSFPVVTIANQSKMAIDIYDVFNSSGDPNAALTYTKLDSLEPGETKDIPTQHFASQLQAMYTGHVDDFSLSYSQFPVSVMAASKFSKSLSFQVTEDSMAAMVEAFKFIKYTTANADSKLAKDFTDALANATDQTDAVNTFFSKTGSFSKVTIVHWTAIMSWQTQFTSPWQGVYYLYSSSGTGTSTEISFVAQVTVTSTPAASSAIIAIPNTSGDITASSQTTTLAMSGDGSMTEQNVGSSPFSVTLQPVWMNVTETKDGSVSYVIGSAVSGTLNGTSVTGTLQKLNLSSSSGSGSNSSSSSSPSFSQVTTVLSLLIGVGTMYIMYKQGSAERTQAKNAAENKGGSDADIQKAQRDVDEGYPVEVDKIKRDPKVRQGREAQKNLPEANKQLEADQQRDSEQKVVDEELDQMNEVLENEAPSDAFEQTMEKLSDVQDEINAGKLDGVEESLKGINEDVQEQLTDSKLNLQNQEKASLEEVEKTTAEVNEQTQEEQKAAEEHNQETEEASSEPVSEEEFKPPFEEAVK